jgi:hypothetical protein
MRDFAWMPRNHEDNILTYFDVRITNGAVEGMNNKAKVASHRCYGFRTAKNYITALYHCAIPLLGKSARAQTGAQILVRSQRTQPQIHTDKDQHEKTTYIMQKSM